MYHYGSRARKADYIVTSYTTVTQQKQFCGDDAKYYSGNRILDVDTGEFRASDHMDMGPNELLVRSYIKPDKAPEAGQTAAGGNFEIMAKQNGKWIPTTFKAETYGAANNLMKTLVSVYAELIVVEHNPTGGKPEKGKEPIQQRQRDVAF